MAKTILTEETSLRIYPIDSIIAFGVAGAAAFISVSASPTVLELTPGTLQVTDTLQGDIYNKKITCRVPETSESVSVAVESLSKRHLIAVYTDERGCDRAMGSPDYPASLTYVRSGGSLEVTLTSTDTAPNRRARL